MSLIQVQVIRGVFTAQQKQLIIERLTEAIVEVAGEHMRPQTWCVLQEICDGDWAIGGHVICADDVRALAQD